MEYGLLGEHLSHSYSKEIHEMLGEYTYELKEVAPQDLSSFLEERAFKGLNVTIPYKKDVMRHLDVIDDAAQRIGAVNTLYFKDSQLHGTNTDYIGFLDMASRAGIDFKGRKVLVMGTGGAGVMAVTAARDAGAREVLLAGRKGPITYDQLPKDTDIIVNATPVGTYPGNGSAPVDLDQFTDLQGVLDLIYNPAKTALILQAEEKGLLYSSGLPMLVSQATAAAEFFTGKTGFREQNEKIIRALEHKMRNISLVGMPGCGKSSLGFTLAKRLKMKLVDTDKVIRERHGMKPGKIIETRGEDYFRDLESEIILEVTKEHGQVIATGGGSILREENRRALRQNGPVIFLQRNIADLPTKGRPLSVDLPSLYKKRRPLYEACSDHTVVNSGDKARVIARLLSALK